jgi:hypothetical protein
MDHEAIKEFGNQTSVLANLHAFRQRPLPKFGRFDTDDRFVNLQQQLNDINDQIGVIACALNELWKVLEPSKKVTR